ncbi:MAG: LysR family transcriptional regulator [Thermodesulfobacteriota bacterium]
MINLNQLRAFYYVAKYSSYTFAAKKLFISQPAVTAQVKLFENHHDLKLFNKRGKKLILTHPGKLLFEKAIKIFDIEDELENTLSHIKETNQGLLELGCTKVYAKHIMPSIISLFHRAYPDIKIILEEGSSMSMINSLRDFKNEVIIVAQMEINDSRIEFIPISQEEIVIVLPKGHPLIKKREIHFKDIVEQPVIMKGEGSGTRKKIVDLFKKHNASPNIFMESNNTEFITDLVERGDGLSFLVKPATEQKVKEKKLTVRTFKNTKIYLDVSMAYLKEITMSPPAKAFCDVVKNSFIEKTPQGGIGSIMAGMLAKHRQNG